MGGMIQFTKRVAAAAFCSLLFAVPATQVAAQSGSLPGPSVYSGQSHAAPAQAAAPSTSAPMASASTDENYRLGTGDKLKVTVYGEEDLSGEVLVDGAGYVQLPLLGEVKAATLTVREFVQSVQQALGAKYLRDPKVTVQIENYRPFYIMGEVNKPGEYPYENGLDVVGAIALAGGYTYRANESEVTVRRYGSNNKEDYPAVNSTKVSPGDVIEVPERIF